MSKIRQNSDLLRQPAVPETARLGRCDSTASGASEAQTRANRRNAQKSTGPLTSEGKATVSKNAVKHGLFAHETVIKGESSEDYEIFRDEMLAELAPFGPVESMLAERFVSLSWRLKRVERMQNQAIDEMIEREEHPSPLAKLAQSLLPKNLRQFQDDASASNGELALGRAAIKDYSNSRVLERLLMYERRIEHSMYKTLNELERLRLLRELEQAKAEEQFEPPSPSCRKSSLSGLRDEAATRVVEQPAIPPLGEAATKTAEKEVYSLDPSTLLRAGFARDRRDRFKKQSQSAPSIRQKHMPDCRIFDKQNAGQVRQISADKFHRPKKLGAINEILF